MGVLADYCDEDEYCEHDQADHDLMTLKRVCGIERSKSKWLPTT